VDEHSVITYKMLDNLSNAFRSSRLVYRAVEDSDADKKFIHEQIQTDPAAYALMSLSILKPQGKHDSSAMVDTMRKSVLAVMICLKQPEDAAVSEPSTTTNRAEVKSHNITSAPDQSSSSIGFVIMGWGGDNPMWRQHRRTSMGIALAAPFQNQGYGSEAINWALDWAFRFGGYHRVSLGTVGYNERADHVYRKLGFVMEGREREAHWHDRNWYDMISYGMLEHEWAALRGIQE